MEMQCYVITTTCMAQYTIRHELNNTPKRNALSSFLKIQNDFEVERRAGGKR